MVAIGAPFAGLTLTPIPARTTTAMTRPSTMALAAFITTTVVSRYVGPVPRSKLLVERSAIIRTLRRHTTCTRS